MSQLTLENLETLKNKMIKDHEAALKLINLSIQQVKDEMGLGGSTGARSVPSPRSSNGLNVLASYDLTASVSRKDFLNLTSSLKASDKIYVTKSTNPPYHASSLELTIDTTNNGTYNTTVYYASCEHVGLEIISNMITDLGLSSAQFCGTLLTQGIDGTKQIAIIGIPGLPYFAINVIGKTAGSKGRPITYFFNRSDIENLNYNNRAVVSNALFGQ